MFQYALYLRLRHDGADAALHCPRHWIGRHFGLDGRLASRAEIEAVRPNALRRLVRTLGGSADTRHGITGQSGVFAKDILTSGTDAYLDGSWSSYKYFLPVDDLVRKTFMPEADNGATTAGDSGVTTAGGSRATTAAGDLTARLRQQLGRQESVALHFALGDGSACTPDYYNWALANVAAYVPEAAVTVLTATPALAARCLRLDDNASIVDISKFGALQLMRVMAAASHGIASDSLACWWALWLNANPDKICIVPKPWGTGVQPHADDLIPLHWTAIPTT